MLLSTAPDTKVTLLLWSVVPVTARALVPMVAPPRAKDVPVPTPMLVLVTPSTVHAMISTMSPEEQAVPRTTDVPLVAVYSLVDSFEPL